MRAILALPAFAILLTAAVMPAMAQTRAPRTPGVPYKPVAIVLPQPINDADFEAMRRQLAETAQRKDRGAMIRLVVARGFFWERENRNIANQQKSGIDTLSAALGLNSAAGAGWEILSGYAEDPTASPSPRYPGATCAPANPAYDGKAFEELIKATNSDASEWGYPVSEGIAVHATPQANAPVIETLGLSFVRILPENPSDPPSYMRVATPVGKTGYVSIDSIAPIGNDQLCYVKDGGSWKIGGYIGGGEPQ
jgi:hypothetical protein